MGTVWLAEITGSPGAGTSVLRFSTGVGYSHPSAPAFYDGRLDQPAVFRRDIFSPGKTGGASNVSWGAMEIGNLDGKYDYLADWSFSGFSFKLLLGDESLPYTQFTTVLMGTIEQMVPSLEKLTFRIRDKSELFDKPIQDRKYLGNTVGPNGLEGDTNLEGQPKPFAWGTPENIPLTPVNTSLLIYQAADVWPTPLAPSINVTNVYDKGAALTKGADYPDLATLMSTGGAPTAGTYRCLPQSGYVRLGATPAGQVTADIQVSTSNINWTIGQAVRAIIRDRGGLSDFGVNWAWDMQAALPPYGVSSERASDATYWDSNGFLSWAPHNLCTWSQDLTNAAWTKTAVTPATVTDVLAPDGAATLQKVSETTAASLHGISRQFTNLKAGERYSFSFFMKKAELAYVCLQTSGVWDTVDLTFSPDMPGYLTRPVAGATPTYGAFQQKFGQGFIRCTLSIVAKTDGTGLIALYLMRNSNTAVSYTGVATNGLYLWGFMFHRAQPLTWLPYDYIMTIGSPKWGPRLEYDPVTRRPLGLANDPAATNYFWWSASFHRSTWQANGMDKIDNRDTIRCDGKLQAVFGREWIRDMPIPHYISQAVNNIPTGRQSVWFVVRPSSKKRRGCYIKMVSNSYSKTVVYDFATLTHQTKEARLPWADNGETFIIPVGGTMPGRENEQWYMVCFGFLNNGYGTWFVDIGACDENLNTDYMGDPNEGLWYSHAQFETSDYPTGFIETWNAPETRQPEIMAFDTSKIPNWTTTNSGTFVVQSRINRWVPARRNPIFSLDDTTANNQIVIWRDGVDKTVQAQMRVSGITEAVMNPRWQMEDQTFVTAALRYTKGSNIALSVNGSGAATSLSSAWPALANIIRLGAGLNLGGNEGLGGHISYLAWYGRSLNDAEMASATNPNTDLRHEDFGSSVGMDFCRADAVTAYAPIGLFLNSETNINKVLDDLTSSAGFWWGFDRFGQFRMQRPEFPLLNPVATISRFSPVDNPMQQGDGDLISLSFDASNDTNRGVPANAVKLNYRRNYTVQDSDLAGVVTLDRKGFLKDDYRNVIIGDATISIVYPLAEQSEFTSLLANAPAAINQCWRFFQIFGSKHNRLKVQIKFNRYVAGKLDLGRCVSVKLNRFGMTYGKIFMITGMQYNAKLNVCDLDLWG